MIPHAAEQPSPPATTTEPAPQSPCSAVREETATTAPAPQPEGSPYLPAAHREKQQRPNIVRNKQMRKFEVTLAYLCDSQHLKFSSVTQSCPTLCNPMDCSTPGLPVHHHSWSLLKLMCIESVMPSNHLILCRPLLLLLSIFPSIRVFSNESVLCIR